MKDTTQVPERSADHWLDGTALLGLLLFTLVSRLAYIPKGVMGFDGPEYINALKLDGTFNVPPPGNIGYVILGKAFSLVVSDPVWAYGLAGTALSCIGIASVYLFSTLVVSRGMALGVAAAVSTSAMVWYHGVIIQSYIVWLAALPAIGYFTLRFVRERSAAMLVAASLTTGVSTILRPDMVVFGGPLLVAGLILGRASMVRWVTAAAICGGCCCVWFFGTAHIVGGVGRFIELVRAREEYHEGFGLKGRGLVEGVARNGVKYGQFMLWTAHVGLVLAAVGAVVYLRSAGARWRAWALAAAWAGPSLAFAIGIFMGNAGLILPAVPLVYLAAARGAEAIFGPGRAAAVMLAVAALNLGQFTLAGPLRLSDQRRALLNHMFLGYTGAGLRGMYNYQLDDFGIDKSLKGTLKQFLHPEPLAKVPEGMPANLRAE